MSRILKPRFSLVFIILAFDFITISNVAADESIFSGKDLVQKHCSECHGKQGNVTEHTHGKIPNIAGFSSILIYDTLYQFKEGDRQATSMKNRKNKLIDMKQISSSLSEEETEAIAFYLSEQKFIPAKQAFDETLVATGKQLHQDLCNDCHGDNGKSSADDAPILAGQWKPYLIKQFEQISKRERHVPRRMKRKFRKLDEKDKKALIAFYVSSQ